MVGCGESPPPPPIEERVDPPGEELPVEREPVEVPDVRGEDADTARSTLENEAFGVTFDPEEPGDPTLCTVEDQDPSGEAEPGAEITLTLTCEAPDVTGDAVDDAVVAIEDAGYTATVRPNVEDPVPCTVEEQAPTGEVDLGENIVLRHDCVDIPDVVGTDAESARDEIESSGDLTATFEPEPADTTDCTVESQDLEGTVTRGEDVVLTLDCPGGDYG
jgi:beta-lactam-binding protein with PASTA domain